VKKRIKCVEKVFEKSWKLGEWVSGAETNTLDVEASNPLPIELGSLTGARGL